MKIEFTEEEAKVLLQFIDLGVKSAGMQVAEPAVVLTKKIQTAFVAPVVGSKKDEPKPSAPKDKPAEDKK